MQCSIFIHRRFSVVIFSVQFDFFKFSQYELLSKVFVYSAKKNCPDSEVVLLQIPPPDFKNAAKRCFASNTVKIDKWVEFLYKTDDDVILMDCDMLVLKDLKPAFDDPNFDIGYCVKTNGHPPFNGGVVFVRNTPEAKAFVKAWAAMNRKMYHNKPFHNPWRKKYAGMNQAAFGYMYEHKETWQGAKLKAFPCRIWNAHRDDWEHVGGQTKNVHIKSELRKLALRNYAIKDVEPKYRVALAEWQRYSMLALGRPGVKIIVKKIQDDSTKRKKMKAKRKTIGKVVPKKKARK